MKILYHLHYDPLNYSRGGGGALMQWQTAKLLSEVSEIDLTISYMGKDVEPDSWVSQNFDKKQLVGVESQEDLKGLVQTHQPDVFLCSNPFSEEAVRYCKSVGIKTVYEVRSPTCYPTKWVHRLKPPYHIKWHAFFINRQNRKVARLSDFVIRTSYSAIEDLVNYYGVDKEKVKLLYNHVDQKIFHPNVEVKSSENKIHIVNAGRMVKGKRFPLVLNVFKKLQNTHPNLHLTLVGEGEDFPVVSEKIKLEEIKNVTLTGAISHEELANIYRSASFLLNASVYESFGNVVAEAMACGLPVIAPKVGSIPELIANGESGYLVENAEQMYIYAEKLIGNASLRKEMGENSLKIIEERFSEKQRKRRLVELLSQVISN